MKDEMAGLVPRLRFPEFREAGEWREVALSTQVELISGFHLAPGQYANAGEVPYFTGPSDYANNLALVKKWTERSTNAGHAGDTLVTVKGSGVGELLFLELNEVVMGRQLMAIRPRIAHGGFIFHFLTMQRQRLISLASGNLIPGLSRGDILSLRISLPEPEEQQKIASCLSSLDALIAAQADKLNAIKTHKQGLMQQLFPGEGETVPRMRFPEFREAGEWEEKPLSECCHMQAGKFVRANDIYEKSATDRYPCYGGNGLRGYTNTFTHSGTYPLIGRQGAQCGNINLATGEFHATEHAVVANANRGVDTIWLFYKLIWMNLNQYATGQAQPGLSVENLEKLTVQVPVSEKEQQKIASCLSSLDALIAAQADKLNAIKTHKQGLMQQLFPALDEVGS